MFAVCLYFDRRFRAVFAVLQEVITLLETGATTTKRDLYYKHKALFSSSEDADRAIAQVAHMLNTPRHSLHVFAASRGWMAGRLTLRMGPTGAVNCMDAPQPVMKEWLQPGRHPTMCVKWCEPCGCCGVHCVVPRVGVVVWQCQ